MASKNNTGVGITRTSAGTATAPDKIADHARRIPAHGNLGAVSGVAARTKAVKKARTPDQIARKRG